MVQFVVRNLEEEATLRLKRRRLGSRIAKRFRGKGLDTNLPELSGHAARPIDIVNPWDSHS
jgi:hypothetical protein